MLKQTLKKLLTGISLQQEYICLDRCEFKQPFSVFLSHRGATDFPEVTGRHIFLGYKPLVIGLWFRQDESLFKRISSVDNISLHVQSGDFNVDRNWHGSPASSATVARLLMKKAREITVGDETIILYEGISGEHRFLNAFHQAMGYLREKFAKRNAGNVSLEKNLYDQVRIAYALPRNISLITVRDGSGKMNMFPTDLHGQIGNTVYVGSLRFNGKANQQVEHFRRIVISQVSASAYREVYLMGKNHMMELHGEQVFSLDKERSKTFGFPLPSAVQQYRELEWMRSVDMGIHRIHFYKIVYVSIHEVQSELSHIHAYYAQWRVDKGLHMQMLIR